MALDWLKIEMSKNLTVKETFDLAVKNHQNNNLQDSQNYYQKVLKIDPNHLGALNNLGIIFKGLGESKKAKDFYERAITIHPNYSEAHNNLGNLLKELKENEKAKECYERAITINPNYSEAHNNLGILFKELKENEKAKECYEQAITINPNYSEAHNNLGAIFRDLGESQKAKDCYERAIKINSGYASAHNNLGVAFKDLGEVQKAKSSYEKAIKINPNSADAHNDLGAIFKELGEVQKAKDCYERAIKINPNYATAHNNLGAIFKELGEVQKAKSSYEKAIEINPNYATAHNNLGQIFQKLGESQKAKSSYEKAIAADPNFIKPLMNISQSYIAELNFDKAISSSYKALKVKQTQSKFVNQSIPLFRLKHDVQQAQYLISKNYKIHGIDKFQKIGGEILDREENKEDENNYKKRILLNKDQINTLLPFYKSDYIYNPKIISGSCINPNKNWQEVEDEYFNSSNQIICIDDFLSEAALQELREFCLVSKIWNTEYYNPFLGAYANQGFISSIHLKIAIELKQKLPKLFGPHKLGQFWGFKYDSTLGKGIRIHADFALHNLNFWITPDEYNNNKNSGGLKVYDVPAPDNWTFLDYNWNSDKIYKFLKINNANCKNIPYRFNRAVLFNSAYFHETDEIDFKDEYEGRRINNTYLFGDRNIKV